MNTAKWITVVAWALSITVASAQAPKHRPIAREALIEVIRSGALTQPDLIAYIEALGVNFQIAPDDLQLLTKLGATELVQKAIASGYRQPKPGEAPPIPASPVTPSPKASAPVTSPVPPPPILNAGQPPKSIRQERPVLPANVSAMVSRQVEVDVRVRIDKAGKVVTAEPLISAGTLNSYLGSAAAAAAKLWTFQPAQPGDQNVADTFVLKFTFQPRR